MRILYNEGRVVGLSAYELYVREKLAEDPEAEILPEDEWVKSISALNECSMILRIASGTSAGVHDYKLPEGSDLCGAFQMQASLFEGSVLLDASHTWAIGVTNYGRLIQNNSSARPATPGEPEDVPYFADPTVLPAAYKKMCVEYMKINSAICITPGTWDRSTVPAVVVPDFTKPSFVRISVSETLTSDVLILITGFTHSSKIEDPIPAGRGDEAWQLTGGFLGPDEYPWAAKIQLLMTTDSLKGYLDWYLDATLTVDEYAALPVKENKFYFTRKDEE